MLLKKQLKVDYSITIFRCLQDQDVLQGAMLTLDDEINPWDDPSEASTVYRKQLTKSLLYKVFFADI